MPVRVGAVTHRLDQNAFGKIAYDVMGCVFAIHKEFGRFFDEKIYKRELRRRLPDVQLEVPITVTFESFRKQYLLDALVSGGGIFEFKTVDSLVDRHRAQLLHYLLLAELPHGKLVNMRSEQVQHEFVNTSLRLTDRTRFVVNTANWQELGEQPLQAWCEAFIREVGTNLDNSLYEEALTHWLGGEELVLQEVKVVSADVALGSQAFRQAAPNVAFKITTFNAVVDHFETHVRRLMEHTTLAAIQWINIAQQEVLFRTIHK